MDRLPLRVAVHVHIAESRVRFVHPPGMTVECVLGLPAIDLFASAHSVDKVELACSNSRQHRTQSVTVRLSALSFRVFRPVLGPDHATLAATLTDISASVTRTAGGPGQNVAVSVRAVRHGLTRSLSDACTQSTSATTRPTRMVLLR
jgi:hypothetical protein